ncbi:MAG: DUF805 domain-containing protein [Beijerinckiaceae bacterium]
MMILHSAATALFDPRGRADRSDLLIAAGILIVLEVLMLLLQNAPGGFGSAPVYALQGLMLFIGTVVTIRRLHDLGRSGWWILGGIAGFCIWTAIIAVSGLFVSGRELLSPGSNSIMVFGGLLMLPALGVTLWLHLADGEPFKNRFGYPPGSDRLRTPSGSIEPTAH